MNPYRCPVCGGNGLVDNGFYMQTTGQRMTANAVPEMCRSCQGTGIVWYPHPLSARDYPMLARIWDNPEDAVYDSKEEEGHEPNTD